MAVEAAETIATMERVVRDSGLELTSEQYLKAGFVAGVKSRLTELPPLEGRPVTRYLSIEDARILQTHGLKKGTARILLREILSGSTGQECDVFDLQDGS